MFGRKKVQPAPLRFASDPSPSHTGPAGAANQGVDNAVAIMSSAIGLDLDFGQAFIFAPSHWQIPGVGEMLSTAGMESNMRGNIIQLLKSPASVAKLSAMPVDAPLRLVLEKSGISAMLYSPDARNGYSDQLADMQADALKGFVAEYDGAEARRFAVFDLHRWSNEVMKGKIKL